MTTDIDLDLLQEYAGRLSFWARGDASISGAVIVTEHVGSVKWLKLPSTGLIATDDFVVCALPAKTMVELPSGPGTWIRGTGGVSHPGDDIGLGRDLYIQTMDYGSLRYLNVLGPTVIRVMTSEDAKAFLIDVETALRTGHFSKQLLHPLVEIGDQCALAAASDCLGRHLQRLHIDRAGIVRTSPVGRNLGHVGDDREALLSLANTRPDVDPCLAEEPSAILRGHETERIHAFLAGLEAVRILSRKSSGDWRVLGWSDASFDDRGAVAPRSDQILLTDGATHVLYDIASKRAFRLDLLAAKVAGAILLSRTIDEALVRLHTQGLIEMSLNYVQGFWDELQKRGLELVYAKT